MVVGDGVAGQLGPGGFGEVAVADLGPGVRVEERLVVAVLDALPDRVPAGEGLPVSGEDRDPEGEVSTVLCKWGLLI